MITDDWADSEEADYNPTNVSRCELCSRPMLHTEREEGDYALQKQLKAMYSGIEISENCRQCSRVVCKDCINWKHSKVAFDRGDIKADDVLCVFCAPAPWPEDSAPVDAAPAFDRLRVLTTYMFGSRSPDGERDDCANTFTLQRGKWGETPRLSLFLNGKYLLDVRESGGMWKRIRLRYILHKHRKRPEGEMSPLPVFFIRVPVGLFQRFLWYAYSSSGVWWPPPVRRSVTLPVGVPAPAVRLRRPCRLVSSRDSKAE